MCPLLPTARRRLPACLPHLTLGAVLAWVAPALAAAPDARRPAPPGAAASYQTPDDWRELLRLDEDMRRFFAARVPRLGGSAAQLDAIVSAILDPDGLAFTYREDGNFDARETFHRREGNCVAFSILVVAVAREYKLTARFNEVRTAPRWDRIGQVVAEFRHLNVVVRTDTGAMMVDLLPAAGPGGALAATRPIPDARAFAMFYGNAGVRLLGLGRIAEALPLLERATALAPSHAAGWVNLGSAHSLRGDTGTAQACYERALREEPGDPKALGSLAQLCRVTGQTERAQQLERKSERHRERNPYHLAALARHDLARGDAATAAGRLRRAIAIKDDEPEFYELAIEAATRLGRRRDGDRWAARLAALRGPAP